MDETTQDVLDRYDINRENIAREIQSLQEQIQKLKSSPNKQKKQRDLDILTKYKESLSIASPQEQGNLEELRKNAQQILDDVGLSDEDVDGEIPILKLRIKEAELDNMNSKKVQGLKEELEPLLKYVELRDKIKQLEVNRPDCNNNNNAQQQLTNYNASQVPSQPTPVAITSLPSFTPSRLDIDKVIEIIRFHKAGYDDVKGKDIVLFFGKTGAGKTTTINYLAGRTMYLHAIQVDDVTDNVIECKNPLPGFKIGHSTKSETFAIRSYDLPYLNLRLCDTPGLMDTGGVEVDISNSVGLHNTIKYARSVKIVLVVEASDVHSARGSVFKDFLSYIRDFVKDFENCKDALSLFFTSKGPANSNFIYTGIVKLANDADPSYQLFLQNIKEYAKKNKDQLLLSPLREEEREALLTIIRNTNPVKTENSDPELFGLPLLYQPKSMLLEKDNELLSLVNTSLHKRAFRDAEKMLNQIKTLAEEVPLQTLMENYSYAIRLIMEAIGNLVKEIQNHIQAHNFESVKQCMLQLWDAKVLQDYLNDVDIDALFKNIQDQINTLVSTLSKEIREEQSYAVINTKLSILQPIQEHLSDLLLKENKKAFTLAQEFVQDYVDKQNNAIEEQILRIRNAEMGWTHEGQIVHLPLFLARNLDVFSGLKHLMTTFLKENQTSFYEEKVASLIAILEDAYTTFCQLITLETFSSEVTNRYYIVKNVEGTQELLEHIPLQNHRLPALQKLLRERVEGLRYKVDQSAHEYNYEAIAKVLPLLYDFLTIDDAFGSSYRLKELHHTMQLIETQIKTTQTDLEEKLKNQMEKQGHSASYADISQKVFLLSKAREIEKELSTPGLVSTFLVVMKEAFSDKARQIVLAATQAFKNNNFILISQLVQDFNSFTVLEWFTPEIQITQQYISATFSDQVKAAKEASMTYCEALNFPKIAEHQTTLEGLLLVAKEIEKGKIEFIFVGSPIRNQNQNQNADPQSTSSSSSGLLTHLIQNQIQTLQETHASSFTLFMDLFQSLLLDSTNKEKTAASMAESLHVLQVIEGLDMKNLQLKPPTGFKDAIIKLNTIFRELEVSANNHIDRSQFADAEKTVELLKAMTQFSLYMSLDISEVYQKLFAKLQEKKHNLKDKISELLQKSRFTETARALKILQGSAPREYEASADIVREFFDENFLSKDYSLSSNPTQDIVSSWMNKCLTVIDKLGKAKEIQEVDPQLFPISEISDKIASKVKEYLKMKKRRFQNQLNGFRFSMAYKFVLEMEHVPQTAEKFLKELELDNIRNTFDEKLKAVPQEVQTILSSDMDITMIDTVFENLHQLEAEDYDGEVDVRTLKPQIKTILEKEVTKRETDIRGFIERRQATQAELAIAKLVAVVELKIFRNTGQDTIARCRANLESLRKELLNPDQVIINPQKFSEQLEVLSTQNFAAYSDQITLMEAKVTTMKNTMCGILQDPNKLNQYYLQQVASQFNIIKGIIQAFEKHPNFAAKAKMSLEEFTHLLNSFCDERVNALIKFKRANSWQEVGTQLHYLHLISKYLGDCLTNSVKISIEQHDAAVNSVVNELKASWNILMKLNFWVPIIFKELNDTLSKFKRDASAQFDAMSDEDPITYSQAVSLVTKKVEEIRPIMDTHLADEKYDPVLVVLDNLRQYSVISHNEIHTVLSIAFNGYIKSIKEKLSIINQQAKLCSKNKDFDKLEKFMMQYRNIEKALGRIPELFPNDRNEIVEELIDSVKQKMHEFNLKHATTVPSIEDVAFLLLDLKRMTSKISNTQFAADVHKQMNGLLNSLTERSFDFYALGGYLTSKGPLGREIVEGDSFPQFKALVIAMINKITARITPSDALKALQEHNGLSPTSVELLSKALDEFTRHFESLLSQYLLSTPSELDNFVSDFQHEMTNYNKIKNWSALKDKMPYILASVFAVWSISNSASFFAETKDKNSILRPHPIQILSLLRMFEVDTEKGWTEAMIDRVREKVFFLSAGLKGHLIQIGTGEGKSIILGVLSTVLALLGFQISCVCYSSYLSSRDYNSFKDLFIRFDVDKYIKYSTLVQMAGDFINEQGDIRIYTTNFIDGKSVVGSKPSASKRPRILLIDEVDVFFSRDFYGATYNPSVILRSEEISFILEYIWQNRTRITFNEVKKLREYKKVVENYKSINRIIDNAILRMVDQSKNFNEPPYDCVKDEHGLMVIGYREGGSVNTHVQHGYKTCFAYLCERDKGVIQKEIAAQYLGLSINCGQFSYAEVPKGFACILGVTGTLKTLGAFESSVIKAEYQITKQTFTPSIYGNSNLLFKEKEDVLVEDSKTLYYRKMLENIMEKKSQAVLVFFEDEQRMNAFMVSEYGRGLASNVNKITENVENIDFYVKKASLSGSITFLTRVFGRGLDFVCRDDKVEAAGGVHVIQTFLSEDISEEIQIKGRTARQGKKGSFTMILNQEDLIRDFGLTPETIAEEKKSAKLYQFLDKTRKAQFDRKSADRKGIIERSLALHKESLEFRESLVSRNTSQVFEYLNKQNPGIKAKSKTVCISDATGSMNAVWNAAKSTINEMVTRITAIGGAGKSELMWVAYRDYCDELLWECSEFTDNAKVLQNFINQIKCTGGGDAPEAVEIGLRKANEIPGVTRVILIGDAEPHLEGKGNYCAYHKRNLETDYLEQAQKLAEKGIPVYCCYMNMNPNLVESFTKISEITGGKAVLFADTNTLMDVVSENVLHDIGGEELVLEYRTTYHT